MKDPARRYQTLLRIYPKEYRSVRGDEILTTLLDADERRLTPSELFYLLVHAARVRTRRIVLGPRGRPLPQPVRFVTWVLVTLVTWNWVTAIVNLIGHQAHNDIPPGPVVAGCVFFGLNVLIQARRRFLYGLAIAVIASFVVSGLIQARWSVGSLVEIPYTLLALLLLIGWQRCMVAVAQDRQSIGDSQRNVILASHARQIGPDPEAHERGESNSS
jgi:hypothetical protein